MEPQDQEGTGYRTSTGTPPPPLPARQSFQMIASKSSSQRKDKESHYASSKQFSETSKHHHGQQQQDHYAKDGGNYASSKAVQADNNARHDSYQRQLDNVHRSSQDHVPSSYVKLQKEKYEISKQENLYASQRELQKNDMHYVTHQKLNTSNSLPLAQNASYSLPKSSSNNNLGSRCNEYEQQQQHDGKLERNSKYDAQDEKVLLLDRTSSKYEQDARAHEKRTATINYEYAEEIYERRNSKYDMDIGKYEIECQHGVTERKHAGSGGGDSVEQNRESIRYELPHEFKVGEKVTCLKTSISERPVPHKINVEYRQTKDFAASLPPEVRIGDTGGNCLEVATLPSEDELSNGSGSVSPRLRRATNKHRPGNLTPSSAGSRNQSPRPKSAGVRNSHRNSANLTSSTLQEDLMKLINPDYMADDDQITNNNVTGNALIANHNSNKINNNILEIQNRCRSRENLCGNGGNALTVLPTNSQENGTGSEVILTMARPATVISNASTASSPAPSENKLSKEER